MVMKHDRRRDKAARHQQQQNDAAAAAAPIMGGSRLGGGYVGRSAVIPGERPVEVNVTRLAPGYSCVPEAVYRAQVHRRLFRGLPAFSAFAGTLRQGTRSLTDAKARA